MATTRKAPTTRRRTSTTRARAAPPRRASPPKGAKARAAPRLLSGGNPRIAKADGDAPVQAYKEMRFVDLHEGAALDERQLADWIRQAAAIPGWGR